MTNHWGKIKALLNIYVVIAIVLLLLLYPFVFNRLFSLPSESILMLAGLFGFAFANVFSKKANVRFAPILTKCIIAQVLIWFLYSLLHNDSSYLTRVFVIILVSLILSLLERTNNTSKFINVWIYLMCFFSVGALLTFILHFIGIISPLVVTENTDGRPLYCFGLSCSNFIAGNVIRPSGYFDEPGALAYWGIFALLFNRLFIKNNKVEVITIISLFSTLSAAYFVQIALYFIFFYTKNIKNAILPIILIGGIVVLGYSKVSDNEIIQRYTIERFEGGSIRSSRTELSEMAKQKFETSPIIGVGASEFEKEYMSDNPYEIPAKDGIIGLIITYLPLIVVLIKFGLKHKDVLFACLILVAGYLQRPFHVNVLHYLMLYLFVILVCSFYGKPRALSQNINCHNLL